MNEPAPAAARTRTMAAVRRGRFPGWVWAVPLAAVAVVTWLLLRAFSSRGIDVTLAFDAAEGVHAPDTRVFYRGVDVGNVSAVDFSRDLKHVMVHLTIDGSMAPQVTSGTRFYLEGAAPKLSDLSSLRAIVSGPSILMVPGPGASARRFTGILGSPPLQLAVAVPYVLEFAGNVGDLPAGAPVTRRGFTVGKVASVELTTDAATGEIRTPVHILLDPTRFHIADVHAAPADWKPIMDRTLAVLVQHQLRARLAQSPPFIGGRHVELAVVPGAAAAVLALDGGERQIPVDESGGLEALARELGQLPIAEIGNNVREASAQLNRLLGSPQLRASIEHANRALATLDETLREAGPQVAPTLQSVRVTVQSLRQTARELDAAVDGAQKLLGASPLSPSGNLRQAVSELSEAARAVRALADYIDEHPESLLRGR